MEDIYWLVLYNVMYSIIHVEYLKKRNVATVKHHCFHHFYCGAWCIFVEREQILSSISNGRQHVTATAETAFV